MGVFNIVKKEKTTFTVDTLKEKFPEKKGTITQELVDMLNDVNNDPTFNGDEFIDQMLTYKNVMIDGSASIKEYINALKFCAYLEAYNDNATEAYKRARASDEFVIERASAPTGSTGYNELTSTASRYRKTNILVRKILAQSDMPLYLMFQGARYKAVAVLVNEMESALYSKDRITAADKLLTHVKPPDNINIELAVGPNSQAVSMQQSLNEQLMTLASNQKKMLDAGFNIKEAQKVSISVNKINDDMEILDAETE